MGSEALTEILRLVPPLLYVAGGMGLWKVLYEITKTADEVPRNASIHGEISRSYAHLVDAAVFPDYIYYRNERGPYDSR